MSDKAEVQPIADNEDIYDEQIAPLMAEILEICKAHKIPMVASFEYAPEQLCTSFILPEAASSNLSEAARVIYRNPNFVAFTVTRGDGGSPS